MQLADQMPFSSSPDVAYHRVRVKLASRPVRRKKLASVQSKLMMTSTVPAEGVSTVIHNVSDVFEASLLVLRNVR